MSALSSPKHAEDLRRGNTNEREQEGGRERRVEERRKEGGRKRMKEGENVEESEGKGRGKKGKKREGTAPALHLSHSTQNLPTPLESPGLWAASKAHLLDSDHSTVGGQ